MQPVTLNFKVLVLLFLGAGVVADLLPVPNLGPGVIVTSARWVSAQLQDSLNNTLNNTESSQSLGLSLKSDGHRPAYPSPKNFL
jgi:hypothetical protein